MLAVEDSASRYGMAYGLPNDGRPRNISSVDNQSDYEHKKTLDGGDVTKGGLNLGVHLVKRKRDGKLCVQKKIAGDQHDLLREVHLLHHLQHPYIVEFIDAFITKDPPTCSLYIEFADAGGLDEVIERFIQRNKEKEESSRIPEGFIWHAFLQMASALQYIHHGVRPKDECPIVYPSNDRDDVVVARLLANKWPVLVHRDIKPANILLRKSRNLYTTEVNGKQIQYRPYPDVVLADFGLSFMKHDHDFRRETMAGTPTWFAPEAPKHTALGDIWMLGGVILAMARLSRNGPVRCAPDQKESAQWYRSEECRKGTDKPVVHPPYTEDLQYFLHKCLHRFKHQRPYAFRLFKQVEEASNFLQNDDKLEHPPALKSWALPG